MDAGFFLKLLGTLPEVWYLDRGWGTLVDGLEQVSRDAGVIVVQGANVSTVQPAELGHRIILGDGTTREASYVVLATDPNTASKIILKSYGDKSGWSVPTIPIYAAVFDIALRRLLILNVCLCWDLIDRTTIPFIPTLLIWPRKAEPSFT